MTIIHALANLRVLTDLIASSELRKKGWESSTILLVVLLAIAFGLRVWGIWFGLPHVFHNDEGFEIIRALQLGSGEFDFTRIGKGGYFYLLFVEYGILFVVLLALGIVSSPVEFGEFYLRDPSAFYLIGRTTTVVLGTITVYLVYRIGKAAYGLAAALIAAAFLAFNGLHAYLSHLTTVDVPMTLLSTAALYFAAKLILVGDTRNYWWGAVMAALATTTKIPAVLVLVPLLIAHCYFVGNSGGRVSQYFFSKRLWQAFAIFLVIYILATPGILLHFEYFVQTGLSRFAGGGSEIAADLAEEGLETIPMRSNVNLFVFYFDVIVASMTWPVFLICAAGMASAAWKHRPVDVALLSYAIIVYVVISSTTDQHLYFPRYILPALPVMALLGGRLLADIADRMGADKHKWAVPVLIALLAAMPAGEIVANNNALLKVDTRTMAKEWFDANIPEGSRVFIEGSRTTVSNATIPLQNTAENLKASVEYYRDSHPGRAKYFQLALKALSGKTYDLVGVQPRELQDLQYYKAQGVQYFVLRPDKYAGSRLRFEWPKLVEDIRSDPDIELLKRFEPDDDTSARSPLIEIYRVNSNIGQRDANNIDASN